jgi:SpoIID/LytB domain protein
LRLIARDGCVIAINVVGIEDYLQCVIASEMSPSAGFEFLKAHAVISRSWLLAQLDKRDEVLRMAAAGKSAGAYSSVECDTPDELIRWQDREDHEWFDFCADDHCQRYQGIPQGNPAMLIKTKRVIEATWGQVLWYGGRVCDARFSKCCGGALEEFKYCWENKEVPYLKYARDYASGRDWDLTRESNARRWILSSPRAFCNTRSARLLGQVLKDYDSETKDFYRWTVEYSAEELRQIILERTGEDYGEIRDLIPLERGVSGRICRLKIVGSKKTKTIGKELEIRKTLSRSHLYSSAFVVEKTPGGFILHGAGWGHGVGLCQIGAAAMGARGYKYQDILQHYYPNSTLKNIY